MCMCVLEGCWGDVEDDVSGRVGPMFFRAKYRMLHSHNIKSLLDFCEVLPSNSPSIACDTCKYKARCP